jgi:hypothetical protein
MVIMATENILKVIETMQVQKPTDVKHSATTMSNKIISTNCTTQFSAQAFSYEYFAVGPCIKT